MKSINSNTNTNHTNLNTALNTQSLNTISSTRSIYSVNPPIPKISTGSYYNLNLKKNKKKKGDLF